MLRKIHILLQSVMDSPPDNQQDTESTLQLAAAVLFVEVMHADHVVDTGERDMIRRSLETIFLLDEDAAREVLQLAEHRVRDATSLHEFTSLINTHMSQDMKVRIIEQMWCVVFADNQLDKYEEHLVRRIADLLYVSHKDFIQAKHRAMAVQGKTAR